MLNDIGQSQLALLTKMALEANSRSHQECIHNLNNYDTPNFKARHTNFREQLEGVEQDRGSAFQAYKEEVQPTPPLDIDAELARLSQSSMERDALVQILNSQYSKLRTAIYEGRR